MLILESGVRGCGDYWEGNGGGFQRIYTKLVMEWDLKKGAPESQSVGYNQKWMSGGSWNGFSSVLRH